MSTLSTRAPDADEPIGQPDGDDFSLAYAAWALLLVIAVLAALVVALWAMRGL